MATLYWVGGAPAVAQESRATPANVEIGDIFILYVGQVAIATFTATAATVANVTAGLTTAWNNSTHSYATGITASDQTTYVKLLGDVAGVPFTATTGATDGGGTDNQTLTITTPTAAASTHHWDVAENWSTRTVPVNSDIVYIADNALSILYGIAQNAVTLSGLYIFDTWTGKLGMDWTQFATSLDGEATVVDVFEYRRTALQIKVNGPVVLGRRKGVGPADGSGRINLDVSTQATTVVVESTAETEADTGRNCVRLLANSSSTNVIVRKAAGGVGIATDKPGETTTIGSLYVGDADVSGFVGVAPRTRNIDGVLYTIAETGESTTQTRVVVASGVTLTTYQQEGGNNIVRPTALSTVVGRGGVLTLDGDFTLALLRNEGAIIYDMHYKTGGNSVTAATLTGGLVDCTRAQRAQTWGTVQRDKLERMRYRPEFTSIGAASTIINPPVGPAGTAGNRPRG